MVDPVANFINNWFPESIAVRLNRWKAVILGTLFYLFCARFPQKAREFVRKNMFAQVKSVMSEQEFDKHFTPPYNPWEQRFCLAPGGDFFAPIRNGKASIVTGHIETFKQVCQEKVEESKGHAGFFSIWSCR